METVDVTEVRKEVFTILSFSDKIQMSYPIIVPQILRNKTYTGEVQ